MKMFKVEFDALDWQNGRPGVRFKSYSDGTRQIRLVEFATSEGDPHWCESGHIGFVLAGGLEIEFKDQVVSYAAGDGIFIPSGDARAHRGKVITPGTRLVMVEDA
jgi:quercetin dioxygenase-like cupin family protein